METDFFADCSKCFALCCTALAFDRGSQFAHDKAAGQPCHHLASDFRCTIHAKREELGYDGCEEFDCLGAGQRASAAFAGENWRRDPSVARRLYASFSMLLRLQEMRRAFVTAADLEIDAALHKERLSLLASLSAQADTYSEENAAAVDQTLKDCRAFLRRLRTALAA
ncbi:hypothetical protein [Devosia soli]|uniref:hypothetical protein n=1 Tax=Devosia soli TaxID=361041 RepID=UPI00069A4FD9|nr:hypothetical protein [Devosia soli]